MWLFGTPLAISRFGASQPVPCNAFRFTSSAEARSSAKVTRKQVGDLALPDLHEVSELAAQRHSDLPTYNRAHAGTEQHRPQKWPTRSTALSRCNPGTSAGVENRAVRDTGPLKTWDFRNRQAVRAALPCGRAWKGCRAELWRPISWRWPTGPGNCRSLRFRR
jgi:hypothetical protein